MFNRNNDVLYPDHLFNVLLVLLFRQLLVLSHEFC